MYLTAEKKSEIFSQYGKNAADTGSAEGHKDVAAKRALVGLVGKRRKLLDYLKRTDIERYRNIIKELGIRK